MATAEISPNKKLLTPTQELIQQAFERAGASGAQKIPKPAQIVKRNALNRIKEAMAKGR